MLHLATLNPAEERSDTGRAPRLARLGDLLSEWEIEAQAAHDAYTNGTPRGPLTGLPKVDRELGGALQKGLTIVHGGAGIGKSAFGVQAAATAGCPALFISCEMSIIELLRRHTARVTSTYLGKLKSGELAPGIAVGLARQAAAAAPDLALVDATRAYASVSWITQAAEAIRGESPHLLVVVDSAHSWAEMAPGELAEYERLNLAITALRQLASSLDCSVLAIAERNRASMTEGGLSAAAGSRRFEYGSEAVLDLNRKDDTPPDVQGEVPVNLTLRKNRNGAAGRSFDLRFHGALQRFREA